MTWWDQERLQRVWQARQLKYRTTPLKKNISDFMKRAVYPRQKRFAGLAHTWQQLLPEELVKHSCLESLKGGCLQVLVDSSSHLFELDLLVKEGLAEHLRQECPRSGITEIRLMRGTWYQSGAQDGTIPEFRTNNRNDQQMK